MTDKQFCHVWTDALSSSDRDDFVSNWALSSIFLPDGDDTAPVDMALVNQLGSIWDVAHMSIRDMATAAGLKMTELSEHFCMPHRTMQHWCEGTRSPADYTRLMIAENLGLIRR